VPWRVRWRLPRSVTQCEGPTCASLSPSGNPLCLYLSNHLSFLSLCRYKYNADFAHRSVVRWRLRPSIAQSEGANRAPPPTPPPPHPPLSIYVHLSVYLSLYIHNTDLVLTDQCHGPLSGICFMSVSHGEGAERTSLFPSLAISIHVSIYVPIYIDRLQTYGSVPWCVRWHQCPSITHCEGPKRTSLFPSLYLYLSIGLLLYI